jgi:hypothetical protein
MGQTTVFKKNRWVPFYPLETKELWPPWRKFLFCGFVEPIMSCSIALYMSYLQLPSKFHSNVPILPYDLLEYEQEISLGQDVNCPLVTCISLASKDKGHRPTKMECVQWLL